MPFLRSWRVAFALAVSASLLAPSCATGVPTSEPAGPAVVAGAPPQPSAQIELPNHEGSVKFLAFGDFGTGEPVQYELAKQMIALHGRFKFDLVVLLGDNIYGSERPQDFKTKFETPYKPLLDAGVKFRAALGNHDAREQRAYGMFGMDNKLYYTFKASQGTRFFALESTYMVPDQLTWIETELKGATDPWKIAYLHHPLYSSARRHGSTLALRKSLGAILVRYNVSVVFAGHDHVYERTKPQDGIVHFVIGSGGKLSAGDLNPRSALTARGYDRDLVFLAAEIEGDNMTFQAISRTGQVVDSGIIVRRMEKTP